MKISLCIICGNEESIILRCLESAKAICDELCLVRAVGGLQPDKTSKLARAWAADNRIPFKFAEYVNSIPFPHVDDFSAARNLSFSLASFEWCMWLDCDDVISPESCRKIREISLSGLRAAYFFLYSKPGGSACYRERLIRTGKGRWKNRVHETCVIPSGDFVKDNGVVIEHSPTEPDRIS